MIDSQPHYPIRSGFEERVRINVSGRIIETFSGVLSRYPDTLLGNAESRLQFWNARYQEYYLDTLAPAFEAIFQFYQTGRLRKPLEVPTDVFIEQLYFYKLGNDVIKRFKEEEGIISFNEDMDLPPEGRKRKLWMLFEYPSSTQAAKKLAVVSVGFIVLAIVLLCVETLPHFKHKGCVKLTPQNYNNTADIGDNNNTHIPRTHTYAPNFLNEFFILEAVCVLWFTFELLIRFWTCPSKRRFCLSVLNVIDLVTVAPFYVTVVLMVYYQDCTLGKKSAAFSFMRILRVFRIFKLSKHSRTLKIWIAALKESRQEFVMFLFLLAITSLVFASMVYFAEKGAPGCQINHIPEGIWWAMATITTLGYGDVVPVTIAGKLVGACCVVTGILVIALPTPIIINNFNKFYKNETGRGYDEEAENERHRS